MVTINKKIFINKSLAFGLDLVDSDDRLDCAWFNPIVKKKIENLKKHKNNIGKPVKLRIIADVNGGKRLPKGTVAIEDDASIIPYVRATDVKNLKINLDNAVRIPKEIHQSIQNYQLKKDDIAITIVGTIGEIGILEEKVEVCDFTENIARVRIKDENISPIFLLHYLNSEYGRIQTERFSVGSLQYKLSLQSCRNIEIYIPSSGDHFDIKKQQLILEKVYEILRFADKKRQESVNLIKESKDVVYKKLGLKIESDKKKYKIFEQNLNKDFNTRLDTLFNNPLRELLLNSLKKVSYKTLGKITKPQIDNKVIPADFYRLVDLEQIDENTGRIMKAKEVAELGSEKNLLKARSILISKLQPEKGKIVIVDDEYDGCVASSELISLLLDSSDVSLEYLWAVLRSKYILNQWKYGLTGSSRMRIGPNEIKETIIPIPNKKIQKEIVEEIRLKIRESDKAMQESDELTKKAKEKFIELLVK